MFKPIIISLEAPICRCTVNNLAWGISRDSLYISCGTCLTRLTLGSPTAYINLEKEYPESKRKNNIIKIVK